jgi:tripartite ATP-independent transporter DctP family solute receptor
MFRRRVLTSVLIALFVGIASLQAQPIRMIFSHASAEDTLIHALAVNFKEEVEKNSKGKIEIRIYPNSQMGGDRENFEGVQMGNITFTCQSTAPQTNFVKPAGIFDLPFLFPSKEVARKVLDGPLFNTIAKEYEKVNVKLLGIADQDFRELTLNKSVTKVSDLSGVKIRTMENPNHMATWKSLGANPTPVPFNEVYIALQQKMVEGQENPYEYIVTMKFFEQQKYLIHTNHIFQTMGFVMNKATYDKLNPDLKTIIDTAAKNAVAFERKGIDAKNSSYLETIKKSGMQVIDLSPAVLSEFQKKSATVYDMIRKNIGGIVDEAVEAVKEAQK